MHIILNIEIYIYIHVCFEYGKQTVVDLEVVQNMVEKSRHQQMATVDPFPK